MEWDLKTIGIIMAVFFIGYIIGLVEASIKQKNIDKKKAKLEEKELMELPPAPLKQPNVISINRNPSNNLVIELEGRTISNKEELTPENKRLLVDLLVEVRPWLESTVTPPVIQQAEPHPDANKIKPQTAPPMKQDISTAAPPGKLEPSTSSIVSQIDTVLQNRLANSPLAKQGIRLQESPTGEVIVYVGLKKYEGIDAIPDPEIKTFIRQAVAEWEEQS